MEKVIDIAKLSGGIFGMPVDICRYCSGTCEMSMRETSNREWGIGNREESITHSPLPITYLRMLWIWREETND